MTTPEATTEDSRRSARRPRAGGGAIAGRIRTSGPIGWLVLALGVVAALLLFVTELATLSYRTLGIGACDDRVQNPGVCSTSGGEAHGHALWLIALVVLLFAFGTAVGRSRPAAAALVVCGAIVLGIALIGDSPTLGEARGLEAIYTNVKGHAGVAFALEIAGGLLAIGAGALGLTLGERLEGPNRSRRRQ